MYEHAFNPVLFSIGQFEARWYGLMYVFGFFIIYFFLKYFAKKKKIKMNEEDIDIFMIIMLISMIIGARFFEVFIYNVRYYMRNPAEIYRVWHGGLSFHGGLLGMIIAAYIYCKVKDIDFLELADIMVIPAGLVLALGRIGNFINGELYGRITEVPWCFRFVDAYGCRHPSQLYEAAKNVLIFGIVFPLRNLKLARGTLLGVFMLFYGMLRFGVEYLRQPVVMVGPLTMGQFLSIFLIIAGLFFVFRIKIELVLEKIKFHFME